MNLKPNRVVRSVVSWGEQWQTKLWPHTDSNLSYTIHTVWKIRKKSHTHYRIRGFWIFPQKVRELSNSPNPVASKLYDSNETFLIFSTIAILCLVNERNHFFGFGKTQTQTKKFRWNPNRNINRNPVLKYRNNFWNKNSIDLGLLFNYGTQNLIHNNFPSLTYSD